MNLKNKTILVTGSSSGIGQAIAIACAKKEAIVLIAYRKNLKGAEETLKEVEKYSKGFIFQADLTDESQIEKMFLDISEKAGSIDVLVNNAGDAQSGDFFNNKMWKDNFQNIFFSAVHTSQKFLKQNEESNLRKILNISSYFGNIGFCDVDFFSYGTAKSAMSAMTATLAKVSPKVLVNAIAPGYVLTPPWFENMSEEDRKVCAEEEFIKRFIKPEEIADMATTILENDAMTGQIVTIDGGLFVNKIR